jgi:hypothetical protein
MQHLVSFPDAHIDNVMAPMYPKSGGTVLHDPTRAGFPFSSSYVSTAQKAKQQAAKRALVGWVVLASVLLSADGDLSGARFSLRLVGEGGLRVSFIFASSIVGSSTSVNPSCIGELCDVCCCCSAALADSGALPRSMDSIRMRISLDSFWILPIICLLRSETECW